MVRRGGKGVLVHHMDQRRGLIHLGRLRQAEGAVHSGAVGQVIDTGGVLLAVRLGVVAAGGGELLVVGVGAPHLLQQVKGAGRGGGLIALAVVLRAAGGETQGQHGGEHKGNDFFHRVVSS